MKRFLTIFLALTCLMPWSGTALAAVECTVPKELSSGTAAPDVLIIGGVPEDNTAPDSPALDMPADGASTERTAEGKYVTMGDLYQAWGGYEGYPDYICGVWSTDGGSASVLIVKNNERSVI